MAKVQTQTENLSVKEINNLSTEEKEKQGEIYRVCYLQDGENIAILDDKDAESLQRHTSGKTDSNGKLHYYYSLIRHFLRLLRLNLNFPSCPPY